MTYKQDLISDASWFREKKGLKVSNGLRGWWKAAAYHLLFLRYHQCWFQSLLRLIHLLLGLAQDESSLKI